MATSFTFDDKKIIEPGVYSRVQAVSNNQPFDASYGNVLLIDTGEGAGWGAGSGVTGTLKQNKDSVLTYDNIKSFKNEVRGGKFWKLSEFLFRPNGFGDDGISKLHFIKAASTTPAEIAYTFTGGLSIGNLSYTLTTSNLPTSNGINGISEDSSNNLFVGTGDGDVYKSTDNGSTWTSQSVGASNKIVRILIDSNDNIYALSNGDGVYESTDGGTSWTQNNTGLGTLQIKSGVIDSNDNIYIGTVNGVYKYDGSSWNLMSPNTNKIEGIDVDTNDNVYALIPRDNIYKSIDGGNSWNGIADDLMSNYSGWEWTIFVDSNDVIFAGTSEGLYRKAPNDNQFNNASTGINENITNNLVEETGNEVLFAISNSNVYRSTDGGLVWEEQTGSINTSNLSYGFIDSNNNLFLSEDSNGIWKSDSTVGGSGSPNGGSIVVQVNNEGPVGNGSINTNGTLTQGYAGKMRKSNQTSGKYVIDFYVGKYKGADNEGDPWDFIPEDDYTEPELLVVSPEFDNIQTLIEWANDDVNFQAYFTLKTSSVKNSGAVDSDDLSNNTGYNLASGGTESYSGTELDNVLDSISELNYTFVLSDKYGTTDAKGSQNDKILSHLINDAKYDKFIFVGGGSNQNEFNTTNGSVGIAQYFDHEKVYVVHGDYYQVKSTGGMKKYDVLFKTASMLGRAAGIEPQVPLTFKGITMAKDEHVLSKSERRTALQSGVMFTKYDDTVDKFIVEMGINTIQNNQNVVNRNGKSYLLSFNRIEAQINKLLILNARITLLDTDAGPNVNTISEDDLREFTKDVLNDNTADDNNDDLIIDFANITTNKVQDSYEVQYEFAPNLEINKLFFTGRAII